MNQNIVTRFAPSPTGPLHLGGMRAALMNWIVARSQGGVFRLRIEDTDRTRNLAGAHKEIINFLKWLNLDWDKEIIFQSQNQERHKKVALEVFKSGNAYICKCLTDKKEENLCQCRGKNFPIGNGAMRFKTPLSGELVVKDLIKKPTAFKNEHIRDWAILRSDQSPTYMFSVVVDDHDMEVTHVIRGDDHFMNTPKQIHLYQALKWKLPLFGHFPLILDSQGRKMSKRSNTLSADFYKERYMPQALINYLITLGTSYDNVIPLEEVIQSFNINKIYTGAPRFDEQKLNFINRHHMRKCHQDDLIKITAKGLAQIKDKSLDQDEMCMLEKAMPYTVERAYTLLDLADLTSFIVKDGINGNSNDTVLNHSEKDLGGTLHLHLKKCRAKDHQQWEKWIRNFTNENGISMKIISDLIRKIFIGKEKSLSISSILFTIGKKKLLERLELLLIL